MGLSQKLVNTEYLRNIIDGERRGPGTDNYNPAWWEALGGQDPKPRSLKALASGHAQLCQACFWLLRRSCGPYIKASGEALEQPTP